MLRIIGGTAKGHPLKVPPGMVRPATARTRTALFDYLSGFLPDAKVLDLYCGCGSLGFEALSRGAIQAWFVDNSACTIDIVKDNAEHLGFAAIVECARQDVFSFLRRTAAHEGEKFDLVFAAPPYKIAQPSKILDSLAASRVVCEKGLVCLEYSRHTDQPSPVGFDLGRRKIYGETVIEVWEYKGERKSSEEEK